MKLSLRTKFTLVLLASSFLSLFMGGIIARAILVRQFSDLVSHQSFQRFQTDVTAYLKTYGSWEQAQQKESFEAFEERRQHLLPPPLSNEFGLPEAQASEILASSPSQTLAFADFALTDPNGRILKGTSLLKTGTIAPPSLQKLGKPIIINGKTIAFALPNLQPNLDASYMNAMRLALMSAGLTAGVLALFLGLVIGSRVNGRLSRLTFAITKMREGNLYQRVEESSQDEIGILANTFNQMSVELAEAHDALQKSHLQITSQANKLKELTIRDDLTGLYNRRHANEEGARLYEEAIQKSQPLTVVMGDVDFFKEINDRYSHAVGDEVLRQIANYFHKDARSSDLLARYGGEEFVLVLPRTPVLSAASLCERLRKTIEQHPWAELAPGLYVTISFGLCDDTSSGSFEKQLELADDKLREAKQDGRNLVCFDIKPDSQGSRVLL